MTRKVTPAEFWAGPPDGPTPASHLVVQPLAHERAAATERENTILRTALRWIIDRYREVGAEMPDRIGSDGERFSAGYYEGIGQAADKADAAFKELKGERERHEKHHDR